LGLLIGCSRNDPALPTATTEPTTTGPNLVVTAEPAPEELETTAGPTVQVTAAVTDTQPAPPPAAPDPAMQERMDALLRDLVDRSQFAGSVLVAKDGVIILDAGYGLADFNAGIPNGPQTKFLIGSLTKQFTAAAILELQEAGLLAVGDPLSRFLSDYPQGEGITIHQVLTHTAGIPEYTERPDLFRIAQSPISLDDLIDTFSSGPLDFPPGSRFRYSNSGYILLTKIVEVASGQAYPDFIVEHILQPAEMFDSGYDYLAPGLTNLAKGYQLTPGGPQNAPVVDPSFPSGAGALYSTVEDLYRWHQALNTDLILSAASRETMFTPWVDMDEGGSYGYGWQLEQTAGRPSQTHGGGIPGFNSYILRFPGEDAVVIVLSNATQNPPRGIAESLGALLFAP
jgi:CubicO group peptidase (beta-lactamase class C family)